MSPGAYIFQRPFLRGLYSEGLMYGGKFAFQNRLGQLVVGRKFTILLCFYFEFEGKFQVQAPRCTYIWRGNLTEGFLRYDLGGGGGGLIIIWRGLYMEGLDYVRNFTLCYKLTWLCKPLIASLFYYERYFLINRTLASCFKPQS